MFSKAAQKKALDSKIRTCTRCPGLNIGSFSESAPGYGDLNAKIFFVGQSLCTVCMNTQIPFTKGSGYLLDAVLSIIGLKRKDVFIGNIVHCHPPQNRATTDEEKLHCFTYLKRELDIVKPEMVVALGSEARDSLMNLQRVCKKQSFVLLAVKHPAYFLHKGHRGTKDWILSLAQKLEKYL